MRYDLYPLRLRTPCLCCNDLEVLGQECPLGLGMILDVIKKRLTGCFEIGEVFIVSVVQNLLTKVLPETLDQIRFGQYGGRRTNTILEPCKYPFTSLDRQYLALSQNRYILLAIGCLASMFLSNSIVDCALTVSSNLTTVSRPSIWPPH